MPALSRFLLGECRGHPTAPPGICGSLAFFAPGDRQHFSQPLSARRRSWRCWTFCAAGPSLSSPLRYDASLSSPVHALGRDKRGWSVHKQKLRHSNSFLPLCQVPVSGNGTETTYFWITCTNLMKRTGSPRG
ncbi:uncharacterized protein LOC144019360 [Festucalex cinctus]